MYMDVSVNYIAVFVSAIASMALGYLWYSPILFGKAWEKMAGVEMKKEGATKSYILMLVSALVVAYVMAHFVWLVAQGFGSEVSAASGVSTAFWAWLGFVATTSLGSVLWEAKPWAYWLINAGYWLVNLVLIGAIVGTWQ